MIREFEDELRARGVMKVAPKFYLSTEWGVPFGSVAIAVPFYLARPELTELHGEEVGHIEGFNRADVLRYLRHEMGHVVNYAYKLYDDEEWVKLFGSITQPYRHDYAQLPTALAKLEYCAKTLARLGETEPVVTAAEAVQQVYPRAAEAQATIGVTIFVTSLAMNYVYRGAYFPEPTHRDEPREPASPLPPTST